MILELAMPPRTAPKGKPAKVATMTVDRMRCGAYSETSARILGMAPPRPKPAIRRYINNESTDVAVAHIRDMTPNSKVLKMISGLRPKRSASELRTTAPIMVPIKPAANNGPNCSGEMDHRLRSEGATNEIDWVSKPSNAAIRKQITMARIW